MATTPEAKRSLSASTSVVARVTRRPTGLRSKKLIGKALQMLEDFLAQVVHGLLADPLHDAHLHILQAEARENRAGISEDYPEQAQQRGAFGPIVPSKPGTM